LRRAGLMEKNPTLAQMGDFNFASLNQEFDFALAQSVFTHLPLNSIIRCVMNIDKVLVDGGLFFATFFENPQGKSNLEPILQPTKIRKKRPTFFDKDPYHYDFETFKWICEGTGLEAKYIGDWNHPKNQKIMRFTKKEVRKTADKE
jgi:hypothetical protein